jgi:hypothetical protein
METVINDFLEMETGIKAIFCFWAFCLVAFVGTLTYGIGCVLVNSIFKNKKTMA